ncbi:MAG: CooT family nickel-binding protein [Thermodesulfobacteriaceae bacterium]|nr:CooT family nickel-binding protein [Thermodesulfobacteriaceae bacterium]MCX8041755.1 CooT family nickel-binding protein [Thermodesulfobacteriaceae bacterium]
MCQAKIWIKKGETQEEIFRDISHIEIQGEEVILKALFEEPKKLKGKIKEIDFLKGKVILEVDEVSKS